MTIEGGTRGGSKISTEIGSARATDARRRQDSSSLMIELHSTGQARAKGLLDSIRFKQRSAGLPSKHEAKKTKKTEKRGAPAAGRGVVGQRKRRKAASLLLLHSNPLAPSAKLCNKKFTRTRLL